MRSPRSAARSASVRSWAASSSSSIASGATDEQTSAVATPSCSITANLCSARRRFAAKASGREPRRRGTAGRARWPGPGRRTARRVGRASRGGEQVGLEDLDAVEAGRRGGRELVLERAREADGGDRVRARARRDGHAHRCRPRRARRSGEHPLGVGLDAGEQAERLGGLEAPPCRRRRAPVPAAARGAHQRGLQRPVDDVGHPERGAEQLRRAPAGRGGRPCRWGWRAPARRRGQRLGQRAGAATEADAPSGRQAPASRAARRVGVGHDQVGGAEADQGVRDRGTGAARPEQHHALERDVGQPAAEGPGEARPVGVVPDRAVGGEHHGVDRAQGGGVVGERVEVGAGPPA